MVEAAEYYYATSNLSTYLLQSVNQTLKVNYSTFKSEPIAVEKRTVTNMKSEAFQLHK